MDDSMMGDNTAPTAIDKGLSAMMLTHELIKMSNKQAEEKLLRLTEASGLDSTLARDIISLLIMFIVEGGNPHTMINLLDFISESLAWFWSDSEREKALKFVEDRIVPSSMPSDNSHFSLLSLLLGHPELFLRVHILVARTSTLDNLMLSSSIIQLDLDDETQAYARSRFNDYWSSITTGPWANDIVRNHIYETHSVYKYQLPNFPEFGQTKLFREGPYSKTDIQEWLDSVAHVKVLKEDAALMDSDNGAPSQGGLPGMFGSLSLGTDGDNGDGGGNGDNGDNGGSMDTS
ncbi:hypothetical protein SMACR_03150 [Sordaria macrospora]|nr:hypothetical protein SMACR_03150 [Sordaria macrospora]WPJ60718.1 hypothetical protein SMAC4_03150 [Sordaria macrospora]